MFSDRALNKTILMCPKEQNQSRNNCMLPSLFHPYYRIHTIPFNLYHFKDLQWRGNRSSFLVLEQRADP